jgi:hypothetical protein
MHDLDVQEASLKRKRDPSDDPRVDHQYKKARLCDSDTALQQAQPIKKGSPFDTLPPEIRNRIYEYVFEASEITIFYCPLDPVASKANLPVYLEPAPFSGKTIAKFRDRDNILFAVLADKHTGYGITQANRQLHTETRNLFLHRTTFTCPDQNLTGVFCTHIPRDWKQHIRSFSGSIVGPYPVYHHILPTDAAHFPNLQNMTLTAPMNEREDFNVWHCVKSMTNMSTEELKEAFLPSTQQLPLSALAGYHLAAYRRRIARAPPRYRTPMMTTVPKPGPVAAHALIDTRADLNWTLTRDFWVAHRHQNPPTWLQFAKRMHMLGRYTVLWSNRKPAKVIRDFRYATVDGTVQQWLSREVMQDFDVDGTWRARWMKNGMIESDDGKVTGGNVVKKGERRTTTVGVRGWVSNAGW